MIRRIEAVDFFYLAMPEITLEADGSQDALLVRVVAGDAVGWGECEASPLPSIAAFVCPRSHGACRPVADAVLGAPIEHADDILCLARRVRSWSMDLLQAAHLWSGIEIALWDLLGRLHEVPVWRLLGFDRAGRKRAYASLLFGDTPEETLRRGRAARARGFTAVKFGWGPFGRGRLAEDADQVMAAREGIGSDSVLLIDAGQAFGSDVDRAAERLPLLEESGALWLEEPFDAYAFNAYAGLAARCRTLRLAGGEAAHRPDLACALIDHGRVGYVQIDAGRVGGISAAREVCRHAQARRVSFVNHTFTSMLALSASVQAYAGIEAFGLCEYPADPKPLARAITTRWLPIDNDGCFALPDGPGLGFTVDVEQLGPYLRRVDLAIDGQRLFASPALPRSAYPARSGVTPTA